MTPATSNSPVGGLEGKRVVVTGATGFLGSHIVQALVAARADVIAVAESLGWRPTVPRLVEDGAVRFVKLEAFWEPAALRSIADALEPAEYLVHLAYVSPPASGTLSKAAFETERNLLGTLRLLNLVSHSVRRVCFASSVMVYGNEPPLPVSEDDCAEPATEYATAKLAGENFMRGYGCESGVGVSILRYSTVYGPMETVARAIPNFIRQTLVGGAPVIRGPGDDVRDYVHVSDAVRATLLALANAEPRHDTYNVGSGEGRTTKEIAELIAALAGDDASLVHSPPATTPLSIVCDIARARADLGYEPRTVLDEGLLDEIRWFRSQPDLWSSA